MRFKENPSLYRVKNRDIDCIAGGGFSGWEGEWGEESLHQFVVPEINIDDEVLDLCCGEGRATVPLAMMGAKITLIDRDEKALGYAQEGYRESGLGKRLTRAVSTDVMDFMTGTTKKYDVVVAQYAVTHMRKSTGLDFISKLPGLLKDSGGYIVVNAPSVFSWLYETLREYGTKIEKETYEEYCSCSGEVKLEPHPFYNPGEIVTILRQHGGEILFSKDVEVSSGNYNRQVIAKLQK